MSVNYPEPIRDIEKQYEEGGYKGCKRYGKQEIADYVERRKNMTAEDFEELEKKDIKDKKKGTVMLICFGAALLIFVLYELNVI